MREALGAPTARRSLGMWVAAAVCLALGVGPALSYPLARATADLTPAQRAAVTAQASQDIIGVLYVGSAVLAGIFILARSRHARWAAWSVVAYLGAIQFINAHSWQQLSSQNSLARFAVMAVFGCITWYSNRLTTRGVLQ